MKQPIYLDYAATTPVDKSVADVMMKYLTADGIFANPASRSHRLGWQAEEAVDIARHQVADLINADAREIVFTSGATESDNLALKGVMHQSRNKGKHLITVATEHKAVIDPALQLEREGFDVTFLSVDNKGLVDIQALKQALREDTVLVSVMHVNNELGVVQDIKAISECCRAHNVLLHVDAAQSVGKLPVDVEQLGVDLLSISAHKMYGPKGIGALYVRRKPKVQLDAEMHGGGHERGMRSGTLATHQIVGLGEAAQLASQRLEDDQAHYRDLSQLFLDKLLAEPGIKLNGHASQRVPNIMNLSFANVEGELLLMSLKDLAISSGSACTSASVEPSYVLRAIGLSDELAHASLRFSVGRDTTMQNMEDAAEHVLNTYRVLAAQ
ncbi:cysteine desulfurase IscS [Idiomarina fontislapidosi]|uniref:cysteine desulfurase n=1 Tax=Idiomarina fontislapidosi TaxID=263723 RepID=A0A432Y260_9GAMM|nr:IscS subfamily cysteine desulfurase [Idiomarina fontislapidosi]PYE33195.1 cysteine desulfurase IscS [Idiomarina fontislapidosi]RUO55040.1 IscS subfamily cysteine desulfurase [Idiomarina fontislapidosi]